MGPKLERVPIFFGSDIPSSPELLTIWQWARYNSLWLGSTVEDLSPIKKLHFWIGPQLFTVTMFFGSHVLRMKAEHYTSSLQPSWLLPCGWVSSDTLAASSKAAPDTILPLVQWRCRLQSPRLLAFMSCMFAALQTSIGCHQTRHATAFYIWTSTVQLLCLYMHVYFFVSISCSDFLSVFSFHSSYIYIHMYLFISIYPYTYVFYICLYL